MNTYAKYLWSIAGSFLVIGGAIMAFNYRVDPYDIYQDTRIQGFNQYVVFASNTAQRMVKARRIERLKPAVLILGTSRADKGIDPEHPMLKKISPHTYNAAVGGGTIYEMKRYLEHALEYNQVSTVILGLDVEMFNGPLMRDSRFDADISVNPDGSKNHFFPASHIVATLFSEDAFYASRKTIKESKKFDMISYEEMVKRGGAYDQKLFPADQRFESFQERLSEGRRNLYKINQRSKPILENMTYFSELLSLCYKHDIDLKMYISPIHASLLDFLYAHKSLKMFEKWKRGLVAANESAAGSTQKEPFVLMDYSFYNSVTMDEAPSLEEPQKEMQHYLECSHFKKNVGDRILHQLITGKGKGLPSRKLTGDNIDEALAFMARRSKQP